MIGQLYFLNNAILKARQRIADEEHLIHQLQGMRNDVKIRNFLYAYGGGTLTARKVEPKHVAASPSVLNQNRAGFDYSGKTAKAPQTVSPAALREQANGSSKWALVYQEQPDGRNFSLMHLPTGKMASYFWAPSEKEETRRWKTSTQAFQWLDRAAATNIAFSFKSL